MQGNPTVGEVVAEKRQRERGTTPLLILESIYIVLSKRWVIYLI